MCKGYNNGDHFDQAVNISTNFPEMLPAESSWKTFDRKDTERYVYWQRTERNRSTLSSFVSSRDARINIR